jgi:hypothetical protein
MNLGELNVLLTISCCQMKHFGERNELCQNGRTRFREWCYSMMTRFCSKKKIRTNRNISFHSMRAIQRETERNSGLGSSWLSFCGTLSLISQLIYDDIAKMFHLRKFLGYFVWKITILRQKNYIFSNFRRPPSLDPPLIMSIRFVKVHRNRPKQCTIELKKIRLSIHYNETEKLYAMII